MTQSPIQKVREHLYVIDHGMVRSFLCLGNHEALLIDTGFGAGQIHEWVSSFTDLPIKVIFTHADKDHIGNAEDFDERWMHPSEYANYASKTPDALLMQALWENTVIDIGTFRFEVVLIPGHTPGSIALLERQQRFLIGGDSLQVGNIFMFGESRNFPAYTASLKRLETMASAFDVIYASHYQLEVPVDMIAPLIEAATLISEHRIEGVDEPRFDNQVKAYQYHGLGFYAK